MTSEVPRSARLRQMTATGTVLAGVLLPLAAGVLLARSVGADPLTPVNALLTSGAQRAAARQPQLRGCRRHALLGRAPAVRSAAERIRPAAARCAGVLARVRPGPAAAGRTPGPARTSARRGTGRTSGGE
ncbi:hypothetical protein [Streptomyces sp. t39]|uniref:hypothetical protein n=1 Tax=Streptomyces sp. t39 TaxID=1828156 RepID=UPI0011CDF751|nr:hypothetical protein [Streptomyces sp. t39]TXS44365.1 hypothetical protein EAO77_34420 [Streptomyces sp. t39]